MNNITNTAEDRYDSIQLDNPRQVLDRVEELLCDAEFVNQAARIIPERRDEVFAAYVIALLKGLPRHEHITLTKDFARCHVGTYPEATTMRRELLTLLDLAIRPDEPVAARDALVELLHGDETALWHRFHDLFFIVPGKRGLHVFADLDDYRE